MRLNVLNLTLKIRAHRPRVVCFVGKKIWDIYESIVVKTAKSASSVKAEVEHVKLEENDVKREEEVVELEMEDVQLQPDVKPNIESGVESPMVPSEKKVKTRLTPSPSPRRTKKSPPSPMVWTQPRPLRLLHLEGSGYTYFWVTPNTSGLERTPVCLLILPESV